MLVYSLNQTPSKTGEAFKNKSFVKKSCFSFLKLHSLLLYLVKCELTDHTSNFGEDFCEEPFASKLGKYEFKTIQFYHIS